MDPSLAPPPFILEIIRFLSTASNPAYHLLQDIKQYFCKIQQCLAIKTKDSTK
jgi:hypothetical protein